jgi:hypothetical protein
LNEARKAKQETRLAALQGIRAALNETKRTTPRRSRTKSASRLRKLEKQRGEHRRLHERWPAGSRAATESAPSCG